MASTTALAKQLADSLYPDFADLFVLEGVVAKIETSNDLEDKAVIAALATCADLGPVQKRLSVRTPGALAAGLAKAPAKLRATARVLVDTLLAAAQRELAAGAPAPNKKRPAFAFPERLPPLVRGNKPLTSAETTAVLDELATGKPVETESYTPASRAAFGRALLFGWLAHGGDPKARWAAVGSSAFLDDAAAHDVASFAHDVASRTGQSSKAVVLVEVIAAISTQGALAALDALSKKVRARAVENAAKTALQQAAKRMEMSEHDLSDRLMGTSSTPVTIDAEAFVRRLELRMLGGSTIPMRELVESILQNPKARKLASGVIFATAGGTFSITDDHFEDARGKAFDAPSTAEVTVIYPGDLTAADRKAWTARKLRQPFPQLARKVLEIEDVAALKRRLGRLSHHHVSASELFSLEAAGWKRGPVTKQRCRSLRRELDGISVAVYFRPGFGEKTAAKQTLSKLDVRGTKATAPTLQRIARELELLG